MSKAIVNQATDLSKSGLDLSEPDSMIKVYAIIESQAKGKKGSVNFKADVLLRKSLDIIKSQAGNIERIPQDVFLKIKDYIKNMGNVQYQRLEANDYTPYQVSAAKVRVNFKTGKVTREKSMQFVKEISISMQIKDLTWQNKVALNKISILEETPVDSREEQKEIETKIEGLNAKVVKNTGLIMALKKQELALEGADKAKELELIAKENAVK